MSNKLLIVAQIIDTLHDIGESKQRLFDRTTGRSITLPKTNELIENYFKPATGVGIAEIISILNISGQRLPPIQILKKKLYKKVFVDSSSMYSIYAPKVQHCGQCNRIPAFDLSPSMYLEFLKIHQPFVSVDASKGSIGTEVIDVLQYDKDVDKSAFYRYRLLTLGQFVDPAQNITNLKNNEDTSGLYAIYFGNFYKDSIHTLSSNLSIAKSKLIHNQITTTFEFFVVASRDIIERSNRIRLADVRKTTLVDYKQIKNEVAVIVKCKRKDKKLPDYIFVNKPHKVYDKSSSYMNDVFAYMSKINEFDSPQFNVISDKIIQKTEYILDRINVFEFTTSLGGMSVNYAMNMYTIDPSKNPLYWMDIKRMGDSFQIQVADEAHKILFPNIVRPVFFYSFDILACVIALLNNTNVIIEQRGTYIVYFSSAQEQTNILKKTMKLNSEAKNKDMLLFYYQRLFERNDSTIDTNWNNVRAYVNSQDSNRIKLLLKEALDTFNCINNNNSSCKNIDFVSKIKNTHSRDENLDGNLYNVITNITSVPINSSILKSKIKNINQRELKTHWLKFFDERRLEKQLLLKNGKPSNSNLKIIDRKINTAVSDFINNPQGLVRRTVSKRKSTNNNNELPQKRSKGFLDWLFV